MKKLLIIPLICLAINAFAQDDSAQTPKRRRPDFNSNDSAFNTPPRRRPRPFDNDYPDVHDPVIAFENGKYYIFSTGFGVSTMISDDLKTWQPGKPVFYQPPQWATTLIPQYRGHTWAPDIIKANGKWYLYYSCSAFGKNTSAIGVAVNNTLDQDNPEYEWKDLGLVIESKRGDNYNCIDPNICFDNQGNPWLSFGSFWDGIQLVRLNKDMKTIESQPVTIARHFNPEAVKEDGIEANNNEIEAPFIIQHGKYYYLFASAGLCCRGLRSTYHTIIGRAKKITGPYKDMKGKKLINGFGTTIIGANDKYVGVGHNGIAKVDDEYIFVAHAYDRELNGQSKLLIKNITFKKGWPLLK